MIQRYLLSFENLIPILTLCDFTHKDYRFAKTAEECNAWLFKEYRFKHNYLKELYPELFI